MKKFIALCLALLLAASLAACSKKPTRAEVWQDFTKELSLGHYDRCGELLQQPKSISEEELLQLQRKLEDAGGAPTVRSCLVSIPLPQDESQTRVTWVVEFPLDNSPDCLKIKSVTELPRGLEKYFSQD